MAGSQGKYGDADPKVFLAHGLAMQKAELTAVMIHLGGREVVHDGENVPVHSAGATDPERQAATR